MSPENENLQKYKNKLIMDNLVYLFFLATTGLSGVISGQELQKDPNEVPNVLLSIITTALFGAAAWYRGIINQNITGEKIKLAINIGGTALSSAIARYNWDPEYPTNLAFLVPAIAAFAFGFIAWGEGRHPSSSDDEF